MRKIVIFTFVLALVSLASLWITGCTEEKIIEIALNTEYPADFDQGPSADVEFENVDTLDIAGEVDAALADTDYSRADIADAYFNGASYGVIKFSHSHDWEIGGAVYVQRLDLGGPEVEILSYPPVSVQAALGSKTAAPLTPAGVDVINQALKDFVAGGNPVLRFVTRNESVTPAPGPSDTIEFTWRVWVQYQIVVVETADIFDPL
jgi:hypothetical protein